MHRTRTFRNSLSEMNRSMEQQTEQPQRPCNKHTIIFPSMQSNNNNNAFYNIVPALMSISCSSNGSVSGSGNSGSEMSSRSRSDVSSHYASLSNSSIRIPILPTTTTTTCTYPPQEGLRYSSVSISMMVDDPTVCVYLKRKYESYTWSMEHVSSSNQQISSSTTRKRKRGNITS